MGYADDVVIVALVLRSVIRTRATDHWNTTGPGHPPALP
ncbi:hypothetical protein [Arthrobacter sp. UYEF20]